MKEQSYTSTPPMGRTAVIVDEMELAIHDSSRHQYWFGNT
jgi:hypothetical protein